MATINSFLSPASHLDKDGIAYQPAVDIYAVICLCTPESLSTFRGPRSCTPESLSTFRGPRISRCFKILVGQFNVKTFIQINLFYYNAFPYQAQFGITFLFVG